MNIIRIASVMHEGVLTLIEYHQIVRHTYIYHDELVEQISKLKKMSHCIKE